MVYRKNSYVVDRLVSRSLIDLGRGVVLLRSIDQFSQLLPLQKTDQALLARDLERYNTTDIIKIPESQSNREVAMSAKEPEGWSIAQARANDLDMILILKT